MTSIILAIAFAVAPLTSGREEAAYGPSDLVLLFGVVVTIVAAGGRLLQGRRIVAETAPGLHGADAVRPTLIFWGAAIFLIGIGAIANWSVISVAGDPLLSTAGYVVSFALVVALFLQAAATGLRPVMLAYSAVSLLILAVYLAGYAIGYQEFFYFYRFVGLSENPNQTALHMFCIIVVAVASLGKLELKSGLWYPVLWANIVLATVLGILSGSDAFGIALVVTVGVGLVHLLTLRVTHSVTTLGVIAFVIVPLTIVGLLLLIDDFGALQAALLDRLELGDQDSVRLALWQNGLVAWRENWLIGNGPGGWSGLYGPFEGMEAHNSFIDWMTITGILGLAAYLGLLSTLFRRKLRYYLASYYSLLGLLTFTMFHFTVRHPMFWFALIVVYMASVHRRADGDTTERFIRPKPAVDARGAGDEIFTPA